jgi:hypothetical protein
MKTVYIAGPMRGIPEYNFSAFHRAASLGRSLGYRVFSPAEMDEEDGVAVAERPTGAEVSVELARQVMLKDAKIICEQCDAVALLPGWGKSRGARFEVAIAQSIGLEVLNALSFTPLKAVLVGYEDTPALAGSCEDGSCGLPPLHHNSILTEMDALIQIGTKIANEK